MARWRWAIVLFLLLAASIPAIKAEIEDDEHVEVPSDEVGVVDESAMDAFEGVGPAVGVDTVYFFPNNPQKLVPAGEPTDLLLGISNSGDSILHVNSIRASLHLPYDHKLLVQNLTAMEFGNATVPPGAQATFAYPFAVSKFLQPGSFALVASVIYQVGEDTHKSVFYNGTVEVAEVGGFLSGETLFLVTLGLALVGLLGMWIYGQVQRFSKGRRPKVVETGTRNLESVNNEWLQGTAFMQKAPSSKSKKAKKV